MARKVRSDKGKLKDVNKHARALQRVLDWWEEMDEDDRRFNNVRYQRSLMDGLRGARDFLLSFDARHNPVKEKSAPFTSGARASRASGRKAK